MNFKNQVFILGSITVILAIACVSLYLNGKNYKEEATEYRILAAEKEKDAKESKEKMIRAKAFAQQAELELNKIRDHYASEKDSVILAHDFDKLDNILSGLYKIH